METNKHSQNVAYKISSRNLMPMDPIPDQIGCSFCLIARDQKQFAREITTRSRPGMNYQAQNKSLIPITFMYWRPRLFGKSSLCFDKPTLADPGHAMEAALITLKCGFLEK